MATFNYKVVDRDGKNKKGTIEASNRDGAEKKLKADGYTIMSLTEQSSPLAGGFFKKKVKSKDLAVFCKQFSSVIRAGVTIISALELMGDQIENPTLRKALTVDVDKAGDGEDVVSILDMKADLDDKILKIGEKISIRRFEKVSADVVASYIHGGGRIGVLVAGNGASGDAAKEALTNIAMQIAAMNPQYISRDEISADELAKIREITIDSALNDPFSLPKPVLSKLLEKAVAGVWSAEDVALYEEHKSNMNYLPNFLSKEAKVQLAEIACADKEEISGNKIFSGLVEGRISKQMKEICLLDQVYVKAEDGKQTVAAYLKSVSADLKIAKFVRFEVGEGMEKKNEDFAAEVAKQMNV